MWTQQAMAKRIDWEKRRFDQRPKVSIADEAEFRKQDAAAHWLEHAEPFYARVKRLAQHKKRKSKKVLSR